MSPSKALPVLLLSALMLSFAAAAHPAETQGMGVRIFVPESLTSISSEGVSSSGERRGTVSVQSTTGKKIALVGTVERAGEVEVEVVNNGRSLVVPQMRRGYFHAQVILSLGVNMIDVRWRKPGGHWNTKAISIFRSSKIEGGVTSSYPPYTFHRQEREEQCQECHQMSLTKAEIETGMEKSCLKCHGNMAENVFVHGPVSVGICTVCHDPRSTPNRYKVEEEDKVLCYSCHEDRKKVDEAKRLQHGPVGAGMCTVCHESHSSPFEFQLVKSKSEICIMCHQEDADRWMGKAVLHPPFKSGNCSGCHDPHSSDYKYNLKADKAEICALCHELPIPGHLHEAGKRPQFKVPDDFPLTEDGRTMCLTCHDPHGSDGSKLTRRVGCEGCHEK